jgi:hypothetical protein
MALLSKDKKASAPEAPANPQEEWEQATQSVVDLVEHLQAARVRLQSAESEYLRAYGKRAPDSCTARLFAACDAILLSWRWHRHELVGAPEPPTKLQVAISEARGDVERAEAQLAKFQALLKKPGGSGDPRTLKLAQDWAGNIMAARSRLSVLLAELPQSRATREERLKLAESPEPTIMLGV